MSVISMKKLTVIAHRKDTDTLIRQLMRTRCVDIVQTDLSQNELKLSRHRCEEEIAALEAQSAAIATAITALSPHSTRKKSLFTPRPLGDAEQFCKEDRREKTLAIVQATADVLARQNEIKNEIGRLESALAALSPWRSMDISLNTVETRYTDVLLGSLPYGSESESVRKKLIEAQKALYGAGALSEVISKDSSCVYLAVFCHKKDTAEVLRLLTSHGFLRVTFPEYGDTAQAESKKLHRRIASLKAEQNALVDKLRFYAESLTDVEILSDLTETELTATRHRRNLACTECVSMLEGWVPAPSAQKMEKMLDAFEVAYELADPTEEEDPPVLLANNAFAKNFEWVLGMYSYPAYGKFDPTFIMSIFYMIIFGIMFADVGYGLILILAGFLGPVLLKPKEGMKRFLWMFGYCGISCAIFGVLFGAYFGDFPLAIMKNLMGIPEENLPNLALLGAEGANLAVLLDPVQDPMGFLILSLGVGAVHLIAGMAINFYVLCRNGHVWDAIWDIGAYWLLFAGFGLLVLMPSVGLWVTVGAAAIIVLTHGRKEKKIFSKITKGLLGLYDLINYASDLLSYSRILALGLAAGVIAQVINILGTMGGPTVGGFIVLVIAFVIGHLLNLVINVLGTFVHTSRLQYIEFFGKFYEDGGRPFRPALPTNKYTNES